MLRRGAAIGVIAAGAVTASVLIEDHRNPSSSTGATTTTTHRTTTTRAPGRATAADWNTLASSLTGALVQPSDASYGVDRLLYNSKFVDLRPRALAYCATSDDVARCIDFATAHGVALAPRSGGHSYGGYSNCDGLVIDVSRMNTITVDTSTNVATVGAGAKLIDVYNVIGASGRLLPGGSCPTVGIAGLALGGGIGVFARKYGLTTDNIVSADIVTADSATVTADATNHSDLWWASRGGGGGNFGVATSFDFSVYPMPAVTLFTLQYPWSAASEMLAAWQQWIATAPEELWANCQLLAQGSYGYLAQVAGVYCGTPSALASALASLTGAIGSAPSYSFNGSEEYLRAMEIEAGCSGLSVAACHLTTQTPSGRLSREAYAAKSSYVDSPMTSPHVQRIVDAVENLHSRAPTLGGGLAFDAYGGAINVVPSAASAFVHRDKLACIQATYSWSSETSATEIAAGQAWLDYLGTNVFDASSGAYQNYIDPTLENWQDAYYGSNLARLEVVKRAYDPDDVFNFAQSIPLS